MKVKLPSDLNAQCPVCGEPFDEVDVLHGDPKLFLLPCKHTGDQVSTDLGLTT